MTDVVMSLLAVAIPLVLGVALVRVGERGAGLGVVGNWGGLLGVGYLAGLLAVTLILRALSAVGIAWSFGAVAAVALAVAALAVGATSDLRHVSAWRAPVVTISRPAAVIVTALLTLIALRFAMILAEVWWRPLYPWDAWAQWTTKAAVWFETRHMAAFVFPHEWLADRAQPSFTDQAPHYPATVPLMQVWHALALGRFDESLINVPWVATGMALVAAFFGQARALGFRPLPAAVATYALASLPFLNTHMALAGYADLAIAAVYGVAAMLMMRWVESLPDGGVPGTFAWWKGGQSRLLWLAVGFALMLPFIKRPGLFWAISLAVPLIVLLLPRAGSWLLLSGTVLLVGTLLILSQTGIKILNYRLVSDTDFSEVSWGLAQNFFAMGNWHLFWYLFVATLALCLKKLWWPRNDAHTALVAYGFVFLASVFYFSMAGEWVSDFSTVNRAIIHMLPVVAFYMLILLRYAFPDWLHTPPPRHARHVAAPAAQAVAPEPPPAASGMPVFAPSGPRSRVEPPPPLP